MYSLVRVETCYNTSHMARLIAGRKTTTRGVTVDNVVKKRTE